MGGAFIVLGIKLTFELLCIILDLWGRCGGNNYGRRYYI